jgi:hypothetical protein
MRCMSADCCPGMCNRKYRELWAEYRQADADYDPLDPGTSRPEPPTMEAWRGEPAWCRRCASQISQQFSELDDLAALRMAPADGHASSTAAERVSGSSGSSEAPSPSQAADDVLDLTLDLAAWETAYRELMGWPSAARRGELAHQRTSCHAWLQERLTGILAAPFAEDFGAEILTWHRVLAGPAKAGVRTLRKPLRCPSCRWLTLFWTEGEQNVYCQNDICGRILSLAEYETEVERLTAAGKDDEVAA